MGWNWIWNNFSAISPFINPNLVHWNPKIDYWSFIEVTTDKPVKKILHVQLYFSSMLLKHFFCIQFPKTHIILFNDSHINHIRINSNETINHKSAQKGMIFHQFHPMHSLILSNKKPHFINWHPWCKFHVTFSTFDYAVKC